MSKRSLVSSLVSSCVIAFSIGLAGVAFAQGTPRKVFVGVYPTAVPMSYVENGKYTGLSNDILQRVAELQNLKLEYQPMKFDALIPALQAGQIDIGVAGIFITEARKKVVDFSAPYHTEGAVLVAPIGSPIKDVSGLKGKKLAAEQGSVALTVANKYAAEWGVTVRILQDAANMQLAMKSGDVDVMIYDSAIMAYQIRMEGNKPTIKMISDVIGPVGIGFAFQKGSDLVGIVNAGISKMEANGEIAKLKQNYHLN